MSIPTLLREVGALIRESRADLAAMLARYRQARFDRAAAAVAALTVVRDSERRTALFAGTLRRTADDAVASATSAYANADAVYGDVIEARTAVLDVRLLAADAHTAREKALADLETLVGVDLEHEPPDDGDLRPTTAAVAVTR